MAAEIKDKEYAKRVLSGKAEAIVKKCKNRITVDIVCLPILAILTFVIGREYVAVVALGIVSIVRTFMEISAMKSKINEVKRFQDEKHLNVMSLDEMKRQIDRLQV